MMIRYFGGGLANYDNGGGGAIKHAVVFSLQSLSFDNKKGFLLYRVTHQKGWVCFRFISKYLFFNFTFRDKGILKKLAQGFEREP